jgi:magnesium-transporting ATPase (P-type)
MAIREKYPMEQSIVKVFPLQAATKNRSTVIQMPDGGYRVLTTGVAEAVLHKCTQVMNESGKVSTLDDEHRREIMESAVHPMASGAQRVLALAYRYFRIVLVIVKVHMSEICTLNMVCY